MIITTVAAVINALETTGGEPLDNITITDDEYNEISSIDPRADGQPGVIIAYADGQIVPGDWNDTLFILAEGEGEDFEQ